MLARVRRHAIRIFAFSALAACMMVYGLNCGRVSGQIIYPLNEFSSSAPGLPGFDDGDLMPGGGKYPVGHPSLAAAPAVVSAAVAVPPVAESIRLD